MAALGMLTLYLTSTCCHPIQRAKNVVIPEEMGALGSSIHAHGPGDKEDQFENFDKQAC
jgi:hypothetical protein